VAVHELGGGGEVRALRHAMGAEGDRVGPRLRRGCRCFAAWEGSALLGYGWLSSGSEWIGEVGLEITPGPLEAYVWNCVTLPEHRRRGVFRLLVQSVCERMREEGLRRLWIASLRGSAESALRPPGFKAALRIERDGDALRLEPAPSPLGEDALRVLRLTGGTAQAGATRRH
jgi:GNAT superfamily N-acetyltransferase